MKKIIIWSPNSGTGKTTIANYLGLEIANNNNLVAIIELDRYSAMSPFIQGNNNVKQKNIVKALSANSNEEILDCLIQSNHNKNLFTLSLTYENEIESLYKVNQNKIEEIVDIVSCNFDYVIIDIPSGYLDDIMICALNLKNNILVNVVDNNMDTWNKLIMYDKFLDKIGISLPKYQLMIMNKNEEFLDNRLIENILKELAQFKAEEIVDINYYKEIINANNNGEILLNSLFKNRQTTKIMKAYKTIYEALNVKENY